MILLTANEISGNKEGVNGKSAVHSSPRLKSTTESGIFVAMGLVSISQPFL